MRMVDLIEKKKMGGVHTHEEIDHIVKGFVDGEVHDYQMSAWMMAVCFAGMNAVETAALTQAMLYKSDVVDLSDLPGVKVDKHSTGGVGDTTTLVIAPLVAACGGTVAKMSGRGLGHTGGTLDKMESIPGVNIEQPIENFKRIVNEIGLCVIGQSGNVAVADKEMYALRDVTATVGNTSLIASSIMSKKIAAGADAIVLDVKTGSGAFMQTLEDARALAQTMVEIGEHVGKHTVAIITDMNQPLGLSVGNGLEMKEAIELLSGQIDESDPLYEVCMLLASHMLLLGGIAKDENEARGKLHAAVQSGAGLSKLRQLIAALGGDVSFIDEPQRLCSVKKKVPLVLGEAGYICAMDAGHIGIAAQMLGAGRAAKEDIIDPAVGLVMHKRFGAYVEADESLATLYVNDEKRLGEAMAMLKSAVTLGKAPPKSAPIVLDVVKK